MYIQGLIPRNSIELAKAVPIEFKEVGLHINCSQFEHFLFHKKYLVGP